MNPPRGLRDPEQVTEATEAAREPAPEGHPDAEDATTAQEPVAGPLSFGELMDREHRAWRALPFVRPIDEMHTDDSAPAAIQPQGEGNAIEAELALGAYYAIAFIGHVRGHQGVEMRDSLRDVMRALCPDQKWTNIEIAFFNSLCEFIAQGSVSVTDASVVRFAAPAAGDADAELFKLCETWQEAWREAERLFDQDDDHAYDEALAHCRDIERRIEKVRARTAEGVVAKLRLASAIWANDPSNPEQFDATDQRIMCSAVNDVGALPERKGAGS